MREILFRAKRKDNDEWVEGSLVKIEENCFRIATQEDVAYAYPDKTTYAAWMYDVCEDTICQYTEIKDKNGNKIFEGDILEAKEPFAPTVPFLVGYNYHSLSFVGYYEDYKKAFALNEDLLSCCEVIGNIFDRQETETV